ncbi:MAG: YraN family protein [SAR324 cluster bacterium]|nr:YraN family protein [SAR324 cluster bacterium]
MTKARLQTGQTGEQLACEFLEKLQYRLLERNFRCPLGEIDIIAHQGEYLVFCEVKTRKGAGAIHPTAAITPKKIRKLRQLGLFYIQQKSLHQWQPRFDVIAIQLQHNKSPEIEHFINAL